MQDGCHSKTVTQFPWKRLDERVLREARNERDRPKPNRQWKCPLLQCPLLQDAFFFLRLALPPSWASCLQTKAADLPQESDARVGDLGSVKFHDAKRCFILWHFIGFDHVFTRSGKI